MLTTCTRGVLVWVLLLCSLIIIPNQAFSGKKLYSVDGDPIPKKGFNTWSLFLVTSQGWLVQQKGPALDALHRSFQSFGDTIGPQNAALWFLKRDVPSEQIRILRDSSSPGVDAKGEPEDQGVYKFARHIDLQRMAGLCTKYRLPPSEGPYVVVTTQYPGAWNVYGRGGFQDARSEPGNYYFIRLADLSATDIAYVLDKLADQLLVEHLNQADLNSIVFWKKTADAFKRVIAAGASTIKQVKLTIDTKLLKLEIVGGQ